MTANGALQPIEIKSHWLLSYAIWASPAGEAKALAEFHAILLRFPGLPVVTWNGISADISAVRKAAARAGDHGITQLLPARHIDLYLWTRQKLVLPIPGLGLKEVSEYFGISRESDVTSGLAAEAMWLRYQRCGVMS